MKMVENWKTAWRWHSTQVFAVLAVLPMVWAELPDDIKTQIPANWHPWIVAAIAFGGILLRVRDQTR